MQAYSHRLFQTGFAALLLSLPCAVLAGWDDARFEADGAALTAEPHRLMGTPECERALRHIEQRLRVAGADPVIVQTYPCAAVSVVECELAVTGRAASLALSPMRPNGILNPVTPAEGITGRLVHLGDGSLKTTLTRDVRDAIVILDYNAGGAWMRAFRMGARAFIFTRSDEACRGDCGHYTEPGGVVPRFFYEGPATDLPDGVMATVRSAVVWKPATGMNVFGYFKGTQPVFDQEREELFILGADVDSFGDVPTRSPGARRGMTAAALLQMADEVGRRPPRRNVLVAFFGGQLQGQMGGSAFYRALEDDPKHKAAWVETRLASVDAEVAFSASMRDTLNGADPLDADSPVHRQVLEALRARAKRHAYEVGDALVTARRGLAQAAKSDASDAGRVRDLERRITEMAPAKEECNAVQRALGRENLIALKDGARQRLGTIIGELSTEAERRNVELEALRVSLASDRAVKDLIGRQWIVLHATVFLGDGSAYWAAMPGGGSGLHAPNDEAGVYAQVQRAFYDNYLSLGGTSACPGFIQASVDQSLSRTYVLSQVSLGHSGEAGGFFGIYNLSLVTSQERAPREGTPDDMASALDKAPIRRQAIDMTGFLLGPEAAPAGSGLISHPGLSLKRSISPAREYAVPEFKNNVMSGAMVMGSLSGGSIADTPMPGAVVEFRLGTGWSVAHFPNKASVVDYHQVHIADANGAYAIGPVGENAWYGTYRGFAALFDERGQPIQASDQISFRNINRRMNVVSVRHGVVPMVYQVMPYRASEKQEGVHVLSALANSRLEDNRSFVETGDGVCSWFVSAREDRLKFFNLPYLALLNNGAEYREEGTTGVAVAGAGYSITGALPSISVVGRSAADLWRLNDSRLALLKSKNINDHSLAELHGRAEDLMRTGMAQRSPVIRDAYQVSSFWLSIRVYRAIREQLDDLVFSVLILLCISVPFAFALERVVVGATSVYRQIGWFAGVFAATFVALYLSHPAFAIANTPMVIFLGFSVVVMSVMVIHIIMQKFEAELKGLQGMTSRVHSDNVSKVSTFMAAVHMGISTMRRRPMRTALTAVTIILLTYTILLFASFSTQLGIVKLFIEPSPGYTGVQVRRVNWEVLSRDILEVVRVRWDALLVGERGAVIGRRFWMSTWSASEPGHPITQPDGGPPVCVRALLGLDASELQQRKDLAQMLGTNLAGRIILSRPTARALKVQVGDSVRLRGRLLEVGGIVDPVRVSQLKDMDGSSILPVDFTQSAPVMRNAEEEAAQNEKAALTRQSWSAIGADSVAFIDADLAADLPSELFEIMIYTEGAGPATEIAEELSRVLPFPIPATREDGVYLHLLGTVLAASGVKDLFFPVLLGGLVIFGTMLGSVSDRQKEIYTFSALGLAPRHVATLFFAEAVVYSLIGGMGGYLIAQITVKVASVLSSYGWVRVPDLNVSSTNTLMTILIVMATVLLSAVYPAVKASRSANPGLMRAWKPPAPKGDILELVFPFTVSEYDITGLVSFIREHFDNYSDTGLGQFVASHVRLGRDASGMLNIGADVALAPFDLGVSQRFAMRSTPSEIPGIDEVFVHMERQSGRPRDWERLNKAFLDDLRRQFLLWRSLPHETMDVYRQRTRVALDRNMTGEETHG